MQIFLWENSKENSYIHVFRYLQTFIVDLSMLFLLLWNGSETQLLDFTIRLNSRHDTIKFDFRYSKSSIEFSDIKIYKKKRQRANC